MALLKLFPCQHGNILLELNSIFATSDSTGSALQYCVSSPTTLLLFLTSPSFQFPFLLEIAELERNLRACIFVVLMVQWEFL